MNESSNKYAVAALRERRALMMGEIITLKKQIAWRKEQLQHLDASLKLLDPEFRATSVRPKRPLKRFKLFRQGELGRLIKDALRRAGKPLGTQEIVTAILEATGNDESVRQALRPRVRSNLAYLERRGAVVRTGKGKDVKWSLAA